MNNYKEAYSVLLYAWQGNKEDENYPNFDDINEAFNIIKQSLERLEDFKNENVSIRKRNHELDVELSFERNSVSDLCLENKILSELNKSLEMKHKPIKPIMYRSIHLCPTCNFEVSKSYHSVFMPNENNYCPNCGQMIDWSVNNE